MRIAVVVAVLAAVGLILAVPGLGDRAGATVSMREIVHIQ